MSRPVLLMTLRQRWLATLLSGLAVVLVVLMTGALFPSLGDAIGKLELPEGVSELLGGADYGSLTGWMRTEVGAVYGPLVIAAAAITGISSQLAGEEESGILGLLLAHPVSRRSLLLAKAAGVAISVVAIAIMTWLGLIAGVAIAGGGIGVGKLAALAWRCSASPAVPSRSRSPPARGAARSPTQSPPASPSSGTCSTGSRRSCRASTGPST